MNTDSYPMNNIVAPGDHDALCGRGGHTIHWSGNIKFRALVEQHRDRYHAASRVEKGKVVAEVVQIWRSLTPPGRFLTLSDPKLGDASPWHDIGDKSAQKKTAKRLREGHSSTTAVVSDEDSLSSSGSNKRPVRRVSNDSMQKAAKRARRELEIKPFEQLPMMSLSVLRENDFYKESQEPWAPIKAHDLEEELDLDCLFEDIQPESEPAPTTYYEIEDISTPWPTFSSGSFGGSTLLQEIAVSIPSAACLTESILFD
jgi:hypothetical protein